MNAQEDSALNLVNASRRTQNLKPVKSSAMLSRYAQRHARKMLKEHSLFHGTDYANFLEAHVSWDYYGENVGATAAASNAQEATALHHAFMQSKDHRANILGRFNRCGIGIVSDGDIVFETQAFLR